MTKAQKIELRRSEIRTRLGEIADLEGDAVTDEIRTERDGLFTELRESEPQLQAAIQADAAEIRHRGDQADEDGEAAELRRIELRASVGAIFTSAIEGRATSDETKELQEHLKLAPNQVPLRLLRERPSAPATEHRHAAPIEDRAVTPAPAAVQQTQHEIIPAVFPRSAATFMGVYQPTVGVGDATFPVLTQSATPGTPAKTAAQAETTGAFSASVLTPKRIQASFFYGIEDRGRFMGMDESLRMNLGDALTDKLDQQVLAGSEGMFSANIPRVNADAEFSYVDYIDILWGQIDGRYAWGAGDIRILMGPETLRTIAVSYLAATDTSSALDKLTMRSAGVRVSAHVPAANPARTAANSKQDVVVRRGMRRDMVAAIWEGVTLIPDEVTKADTGEIKLTAVMLHDVKVLRADGFARRQVQLTGAA